jgi:TonB family protein
MLEPKTYVAKAAQRLFPPPADPASQEPKQRRLMATALSLLLLALVFVLYHDRDFWFPDAQEADDQTDQAVQAMNKATQAPPAPSRRNIHKKTQSGKPQVNASAEAATDAPPIVATATRTVLPPLEVEVVAGDSHRRLKPSSNSVQVEVQQDAPEQMADNAPAAIAEEPAAKVTDNAAERVEMSAETANVVSAPAKPGYPMLARQMKVQGSVILLAMVSREGKIQDLRVLSGPPILAGAAREAVKQWHFKPHFEGQDAVETVAKVTVNFTISTN